MTKRDDPLIDAADFTAALGLLTRLPVSVNADHAMARGAKAAWAYPAVGVVLGATLALVAALLGSLPEQVTAGLILAMAVAMTGAMHEDGLADTADGLWGGWDRAKRLAIMKDSRTGVYGVCAVVLSLLLRWSLISFILIASAHWSALIVAAALSRAAMVAVMASLPFARTSGLSHAVGRPSAQTAWIAAAVGGGIAILFGYFFAII